MSVQRALPAFAKRHGSPHPTAAMARACSALLREISYESGRPDLSGLLDTLGAVVRYERSHAAGRLSIEDNTYVITVDPSFGERRRTFSIAHEIAHVVLFEGLIDEGQDLLTDLASDHGDATVERLCNRAASELLMPESDFRGRLAHRRLSLESLYELADLYGVSLLATLTRLTEVLTDVQILLLRADPLTSGRSQHYRIAATLPPGSRAINSSFLGIRELKPNLVERCAERGSPAGSSALRIGSPRHGLLLRRGVVLSTTSGGVSGSRKFTIARRLRGESAAVDIDWILVLQKQSAPAAEWTRLIGHSRQMRSRGAGGRVDGESSPPA